MDMYGRSTQIRGSGDKRFRNLSASSSAIVPDQGVKGYYCNTENKLGQLRSYKSFAQWQRCLERKSEPHQKPFEMQPDRLNALKPDPASPQPDP